jgi:hypothetical protein
MTRLPESDREQSHAFTGSLNMSALKNIASTAIGGECDGIEKIYQGRVDLGQDFPKY